MNTYHNKSAGCFKGFRVGTFCIVLSVLLITGCVTTEEKNRMQWNIDDLRKEVSEIKQKSRNIETEFPDRQKQINERLRELEEARRAAAKTVSDLLIRIQYLTTEVQMLTGRFEEARYNAEKNSAELRESKEMLIAKMKQIETTVEDLKKRLAEQPPAPAPLPKERPEKKVSALKEKEPEKEEKKVSEKKTEGAEDKGDEEKASAGQETAENETVETAGDEDIEKAEAEPEDGSELKDDYMSAYEAYKEDRTVEAREKFEALLRDYPENEYSDNARFWIAESYYKDGNYEDAILAYEELFKKNPGSDKVPGALLKQGLAFYALKDKKTGKLILEKLIEKYPDSDQAKLAARKISRPVPPKKK